MSFSENLRELMHDEGMTTAALSLKTDINENTISSYLKTEGSMPPADKAVKIANALGTSVEFLVTGYAVNRKGVSEFDIHKFKKYEETIDALEKMPPNKRNPIISIIREM